MRVTKISDISGWKGSASVYQLSDPVLDAEGKPTEYIVVSALERAFDTGVPETYVFPSDGERVTDWLQMPQSLEGVCDHKAVFRNAGWEFD